MRYSLSVESSTWVPQLVPRVRGVSGNFFPTPFPSRWLPDAFPARDGNHPGTTGNRSLIGRGLPFPIGKLSGDHRDATDHGVHEFYQFSQMVLRSLLCESRAFPSFPVGIGFPGLPVSSRESVGTQSGDFSCISFCRSTGTLAKVSKFALNTAGAPFSLSSTLKRPDISANTCHLTALN